MEERPYYVGIGASAGGLEALEDFFKAMPSDSGMVFIVVQHLSPDYKSLMDELLARHTNMSIKIATDGLQTQPNTIYLIPPKHNLLIFHGKLYLEEFKNKKGLNLPVDVFFRSLAIDQEKNAIGIILSGTGSDGTLGVRAIKEAGGMVMVQEEATAKFDGMPRNSIATGLVDYILPPGKMPEELLNFIKHPLVRKSYSVEHILSKKIDTLAKIILILRDHSGVDFSYYKENTIIRRLERRVSINRFETLEEYLEFLSDSDKEKETLYRELLIGVTRFFRDHEAFRILAENVIPNLSYHRKVIRVWSTGCSTGEEVYSLAMLILEYIHKNKIDCELKIFATDIDRRALELASRGFYPDSVVADVDPTLVTKYFIRKENGYQANDQIRKTIVFAHHNLLKDPPFSKLDLLVCRNLFIYLKPDIQNRVLHTFYYSLNTNGYLFMGSSESIGEMNEAFDTVDSKWKIYRYKEGYRSTIAKDLPALRSQHTETDGLLFSHHAQKLGVKYDKVLEATLTKVLPPSILVDQEENIIQIINDVSDFISIKPGRFSHNIQANLSNEISLFVNNILRQLKLSEDEIIVKSVINVKGFEDQRVRIEGRAITVEKRLYYLISFILEDTRSKEIAATVEIEDHIVDTEMELQQRIRQLERELKHTEENLQATIEELETSNEELQSSNEELISSNEELQSTNEELQSVNEELFTVNSEYQSKIEELNKLNNDMDNLLKNTEVGALYLDRNLCIRKLTPIVSKITNILPTDIGRPIAHISFIANYQNLLEDIYQVIDNLQIKEKEIVDHKGNHWLTKIRPYRTEYNAVEGIMVTFIEINRLKNQQEQLDLQYARLADALEIGRMAWWEWDITTGEVLFDEKKATMLGYTVHEFPTNVYAICNLIHPDDYESTMQIMRDHLAGQTPFWEATYRIRTKQGTYGWYFDRGKISNYNEKGEPTKVIGTVIDVTPLKKVEWNLKESRLLFKKVLESSPVATILINANGKISFVNRSALDLLGLPNEQIINKKYDDETLHLNSLPFSAIVEAKMPMAEELLTIKNYKQEEIVGTVDGIPILDSTGKVDGIVFLLHI